MSPIIFAYTICIGKWWTRVRSREPSTHLRNDVGTGESYHQTVFGRVVLVLVLRNQPLTSTIIGLSLYIKENYQYYGITST